VENDRIYLIVGNPSPVIIPWSVDATVRGHRDAEPEEDEATRCLVTVMGDVLEPRGVGVLLGNWKHR
jgi:hypothetical protein